MQSCTYLAGPSAPPNGSTRPSGMTPRQARRLIVAVLGILCGWTAGANLWLGREWTSSQLIYAACREHPAIAFAAGAYCFAVMRDAAPTVEWGFLFVLVAAGFLLGHCLFPL